MSNHGIITRKVYTVQTSTGPEDFDTEAEAAMAAFLGTLGVWDDDICDAVRIRVENNLEALQVNLKKIAEGNK